MSSKKQFGFWRSLYASFYSKHFYQDVKQNWTGGGVGYFLLVIMLTTAISITYTRYHLNNMSMEEVAQFIQGSKQSFSKATLSPDKKTFDVVTTITETNIRKSRYAPSAIPKHTTNHFNLKQLHSIITSGQIVMGIGKFFLLLIAGLLASSIGKLCCRRQPFKSIFRLSLVAMTPSLLTGALIGNLPIWHTQLDIFKGFLALLLIATVGYFILGLRTKTKQI
jgi:hypothetical protein